MDLEKTLMTVHQIFLQKNIDHALIGGLALASLGVNRTTYDVDMLIDYSDKELAIKSLKEIGFNLEYESEEVCQFSGIGHLDLLLAKRLISKSMLKNAVPVKSHDIKCLKVEDIIGLKIQAYMNDKDREFQDKADILALIKIYPQLDFEKLREYAELFDQWEFLKTLKKK